MKINKIDHILGMYSICRLPNLECENEAKQAIKQLILESMPEKITENAWEDQSVAEGVYYEQQKNIGFNQCLDDITKVIKDIFDGRE